MLRIIILITSLIIIIVGYRLYIKSKYNKDMKEYYDNCDNNSYID